MQRSSFSHIQTILDLMGDTTKMNHGSLYGMTRFSAWQHVDRFQPSHEVPTDGSRTGIANEKIVESRHKASFEKTMLRSIDP